MKIAVYGKLFDNIKKMVSEEDLILYRITEEYNDTDEFHSLDIISDDTDLVYLDIEHTNYSILKQLAKKKVNVLCRGLWSIEGYLEIIREFKKNNKFVIEDESFLCFEKVSTFINIAKQLLELDSSSEIEIKTHFYYTYAAIRILGTFLPDIRQLTIEKHVEMENKEWLLCRVRNRIVAFEIDRTVYYGLERKYASKSVEFNITTNRGNLSLRGLLGPILWEAFFPEVNNNESSRGYLFHPIVQVLDGDEDYDRYSNITYNDLLITEIKKVGCCIKEQKNVMSKVQQQIMHIRCCMEILDRLNIESNCKKEYRPLRIEELYDQRKEHVVADDLFNGFSPAYLQYSVNLRKTVLAQTVLLYMKRKGILLKDVPCTFSQILQCLSVSKDNNDIIYRWIELLKKHGYVTENEGIYVCKNEISEQSLKQGWEEIEYLWKGKLESPLVLDYLINNIKNWDKLIQREQQATLLLFDQGGDIYADALYKDTKILQYLNHSLSKIILGYLHRNGNTTILEVGAGTGATSDVVLNDIHVNKLDQHIKYFYTDISKFFLQKAKERYKLYNEKMELHYQTLDIDTSFSSQLSQGMKADIVIAVGVLNNSVNTDKCIQEINKIMRTGGILLIVETIEDVPDILISQSFMMSIPKDRRKTTNTMFLNKQQWLEILSENGFYNVKEYPECGNYLEILGQKLFYCTKE